MKQDSLLWALNNSVNTFHKSMKLCEELTKDMDIMELLNYKFDSTESEEFYNERAKDTA